MKRFLLILAMLVPLAIAIKNMDARRRMTLLKQRLQASLAPARLLP